MKPELPTTSYPPHAPSPLIDNPSRQGGAERCFFFCLTALIWALWLSLWIPLVVLPLSVMGISPVGILGRVQIGASSLFVLLCIIVGCFLFTIAWVECKKRLPRPRYLRKQFKTIPENEIDNPDGLDTESTKHLSFASKAKIYFNKIGKPVKVQVSGKR